ncbi:MAG: hypothetical protein ABFD44_02555 [Anaerolineaceae bacterium]
MDEDLDAMEVVESEVAGGEESAMERETVEILVADKIATGG